ncbi:MAG: hypothetical protein IT301_08080 [Dehalococcoidia bacterium]|nr:hypothetical protein [Dehalococcoidia bacterium]
MELLGEVSVDEAKIDALCVALGRVGLAGGRLRWPHCFASALVGVARYRYDGDAFWPRLKEAFGFTSLHAPEQQDIGQWFEVYLARNRLPQFRHLVEQGALRYLTPILAHALIPRVLVPKFLESVVWPSVEDPVGNGATGDDIQQRMARQAPVMARPLQRFVVHGGHTARDIIDRSILVAAGAAAGEDSDPGLPDWLRKAIVTWVQDPSRGRRIRARVEQRRRWKSPVLRFDPVYNRVQLELPYFEEPDSAWEVQLPGGLVHREAWKPAWQRTGPTVAVTIERPFAALTAMLKTVAGIAGTRTFDGLSTARPCLFFERTSGRVTGASGFLSGARWYLVAPVGAEVVADGQALAPREHLGEPLGGWSGLVVGYYEAPAGTQRVEVRIGGSSVGFRLVEQPPNARLEVPELPAFLAATSDGVLAFESELPTVILPPAPPESDAEEYLARWSARVSSDDGAEGQEHQPASALSPERLPDGSYRLRLEELIPGVDVGEWTVEVAGPLGRGFTSRLSLLPAMGFKVEEAQGVAGPELPLSSVFVTTRDGIRVTEEADSASPTSNGWVLHDRNRNGRIPFTVTDTRTGRETHAVIQLGTVQWRWTGVGLVQGGANTPERFSIDALAPGSAPRLLASNPGEAALHLRLIGPAGAVLQEEVQRPLPGRGAVFALSPFLTTAADVAAPSLRLSLELVSMAGDVLGGTVVGNLSRDIQPVEVRVQDTEKGSAVHWRLPRSFPGTVARVASLSRPWDPPLESSVVDGSSDGQAQTEVERLAPGRYQLELWFNDGWVGLAPLGSPVEFHVGTGTELRNHILALPPTILGKLEDILLRGEEDRRPALRELASGIGPHQLAEVIGAVRAALAQGRAGELLGLPWTEVAPALADLKLSDPLPLLEAIGGCPPNPGLARFCVAVGLDRWPSLRRVDVPATLLPSLWEAWPPLGAFIDAGGARVDRGSAERCQDGLGWAPGEIMICDGCGDPMEAEGPCAACGSSSVVFEARPLPDGGAVEGQAFRPQPALVRAMRDVLLPVPSLPFGPDGWVAASLESLDSLLTVPDSGALESERDAQVEAYRQHLVPHEARIAQGVRAHALMQRDSHPQQYPWAYVCRMSLTIAFARRLMARSRLSLPADAAAALDELAAWLAARFARIYERDLCFAELVCCKESEWT